MIYAIHKKTKIKFKIQFKKTLINTVRYHKFKTRMIQFCNQIKLLSKNKKMIKMRVVILTQMS